MNRLVVEGEKNQDYLGDGVYVSSDGYQYWLRIERDRDEVHEIALDPHVVNALLEYWQRLGTIK